MKLYRDNEIVFDAPGCRVDALEWYTSVHYHVSVCDASVVVDSLFSDGDFSIVQISKMADKDFFGTDLIVETQLGAMFVYDGNDYHTDNEGALNLWYKVLSNVAPEHEWKIALDENPIYDDVYENRDYSGIVDFTDYDPVVVDTKKVFLAYD